jgi:hypothetical protein
MNDEDLEQLLRRYEPAAPSPLLRARVLRPPVRTRSAWPWAAAAAALLAVSVWLGSSAERLMQRSEVNVDVAARQRSLEVEALTEMVGDADNPRTLAEWMIQRRDADRAIEAPRQPVATTGAGR